MITISVLAVPPKESSRSLVTLQSRYGTNFFYDAKAEITFPKELKDMPIILASTRVWPLAPVFPIFYEPDNSTKFNLDTL